MRTFIVFAFIVAIGLIGMALYGCSDDTEEVKDAGADAALVETGPAEASVDQPVTQPEASVDAPAAEATAGDANAGDTATGE